MADAIAARNAHNGPLPVPVKYGGGFLLPSAVLVVNDTIANVFVAFGKLPSHILELRLVQGAGASSGTVQQVNTSFVSAEQTGTGSAQSIAHGLGSVPAKVFVTPTDTSPATVGVFTVTEGAHDSTNVIVTVTSGKKFKVIAFPAA